MKLIIVALAVVAIAVAAPAAPPPLEPIKLIRSEFDQKPDGPYQYSFETENGIKRNEQGEVKEVLDADNKPQKVIVMRGSYAYLDSQGKPITIIYYADETGFHAEGDSIPKGPARR